MVLTTKVSYLNGTFNFFMFYTIGVYSLIIFTASNIQAFFSFIWLRKNS